MKTHYSKEDLFHSLPDYISGNIDDSNLKSEIRNEIENNTEFKYEFEELKKTFQFLNSTEFESPNESYFNNLPVKINNRIQKEHKVESFWEKLGLIWKILIPAIPVIILAIIFYNNFKNAGHDNILTDNGDKKVETIVKQSDSKNSNSLIVEKNNDVKNNIDNTHLQKLTSEEKKSKKTNRSVKNNRNYNSSDDKTNTNEDFLQKGNIAETLDNSDITNTESEDDVFYTKDVDEENYEDEFLNLTPEEQKEVIENLNKSKI